MECFMNTAKNIKQLIERTGLSDKELATKLGYKTTKTVARWRVGENTPKKHVFDALIQIIEEKRPHISNPSLFTFIDLFAGIGGMRKAFEAVGGQCVATCEWDKYARQTYSANFAVDHPFIGDIQDVTRTNKDLTAEADDEKISREIPDHDVLVAGFPCQPFSIAGVSKKNALGRPHGFADEAQGTLFYDVARILKVKKPKAFLLENVKNLIRHDKGNTFKVIMNVLTKELGYYVSHKVVDAKGFVPQHRERTIIVGFRADVDFSWSNVIIPDSKNGPTMSSILHNSDEEADGQYTIGSPARVNPKYTLTEHLWDYLQKYAKKHRDAGNGFGYGMVTGSKVARTLSARYYKDGSEILVSRGSGRIPRRLTPRECARLMGFDRPGQALFKIPVSDTQAYKQFGNSVVVPVIEAVAKAMIPCLSDMDAGLLQPRLPLFSTAQTSNSREPEFV
jgi:DNA (cytosine-5)-methyltransferase 1